MIRMKQLGLVVIVATALASPARAETWGGTITLTNVVSANDRDYGASGTATLSDAFAEGAWGSPAVDVDGYGYLIVGSHLTMTCEGLTPGATYAVGPTSVVLYPSPFRDKKNGSLPGYSSVTASADGTLELDIDVTFIGGWYYWWDPAAGTALEGWGWWEFGGYSDYGIAVARKQGSKYTQVLAGSWSVSGD
jgi:hypothetical protein